MTSASPTLLQRYHLLRKIATGGMAEVFLAEQTGAGGFKKRVAIKRILPQFAEDPQFVEMFLDEARLAALFHHPNLIQIYELGEVDGLPCLVMEYVRGLSLMEIVKRSSAAGHPRLPLEVTARIVAQACEGLEYAHAFRDPDTNQPLGLVHRDVSPQNILVSTDGIAKVMDFGIAKATGNLHHTSTGLLKGKLAYMPPEQLNGKSLDRRADVWALGIVLYELLAGRRPFVGDNEAVLLRAILLDEVPPLEGTVDDVPVGLRTIVHSALQRDPDKRTSTAGAMAHELDIWLGSRSERTGPATVAGWLAPLLPTTQAEAARGASTSTPPSFSFTPVDVPLDFTRELTDLMREPEAKTEVFVPPTVGARSWPWLVAGGAGAAILSALAFALVGVDRPATPKPAARPQASLARAPSRIPVPSPMVAVSASQGAVEPPIAAAAIAPATVAKGSRHVATEPSPSVRRRAREPLQSTKLASASADDAPLPGAAAVVLPIVVSSADVGPSHLSINTEPWSRVSLDGREIGVTPLPDVPVSAGSHLLVCENPEQGLAHTETVVIPPGGKVIRFIQLSPPH